MIARRVLGVPLHAHRDRQIILEPHGLNDAIWGNGLYHQRVSQPVDTLPVQRVDFDLVATHMLPKRTAGSELYCVTGLEDFLLRDVVSPRHAMVV